MRIVERRPRREDRGPEAKAPMRPPSVKMEVVRPIWKDVIGIHCGRVEDSIESWGSLSFASAAGEVVVSEMERRLQVMTS